MFMNAALMKRHQGGEERDAGEGERVETAEGPVNEAVHGEGAGVEDGCDTGPQRRITSWVINC